MLLKGKKGVVLGVANDKSIAWGIAKMASEHGAELAFSYQGENLKTRVEPLAQSIGSSILVECDVSRDESIENLFSVLKEKWGKIDFIIHSIAFANKEYLKNEYFNVTRDAFSQAMDISVYSLTAICKHAEPMLNEGGSILTLTYHGAQQVVKNYNVMGVAKAALECSVKYLAHDLGHKNIRVNAISAGPIRTLAASGIGDFKKMLKEHESIAPLKRNTTLEDVAGTGVYLLSSLSSGVTGENVYVDCGYSVMSGSVSE